MPDIIFDPHNYAISVFALPVLIIGLVMLCLGGLVLIRERGSQISCAFFLLCASVAICLLGFAAIYSTSLEPLALIWTKLEHLGVVLIPSTIVLFAFSAVRQTTEFRFVPPLNFVLSAIFYYGILYSNEFVVGLDRNFWGYYPRYGPLSIPFLLFFVSAMAMSLRLLWVGYKQSPSRIERQRARGLLIAFSIAYLASVDFLPAYGIRIYPFGYFAVLAFIVLSAWAIWRYRLVSITPGLAANQIIATMADALLVTDMEGIIRVANGAACQLLGIAQSALIGKRLVSINQQLLSPELLSSLLTNREIDDYETMLEAPQKGMRVLSLSASIWYDDFRQPAAIICIARDITRRKRAEELARHHGERLQILSQRLQRTEESQRKLLAGDLHDTVLQWLAGARFRTEIAQKLLQPKDGDQVTQALREIQEILGKSIEELRATIVHLYPPELEKRDLANALQQYVQFWREQTKIAAEVKVEGDVHPLAPIIETSIYRICQEALNNIAKHSSATQVTIDLHYASGLVYLAIQDNGVGFDTSRLEESASVLWYAGNGNGSRPHIGLFDMSERAHILGGTLEITSEQGTGTRICMTLPDPATEREQDHE